MSSAFYQGLKTTAASLLTKYGQTVTLRNIAVGTYDPNTGTVTGGGPVDVARKGALFDFNAGESVGPGGLVQIGDKKLLLEAGTIPKLEDLVVMSDGTIYTIKGIGETNPAGTPVMYTLHLRK